ncbi:MAG: ATP-grasp domain-containing protein, partial [Planctomycetaceae bacterium]
IPVTGGASSYRESVPLDATLYGHAVRLLQALRWTGLAMVEFKVHTAGATLMEINGRVWGSLPLAVRCGVDFPGRLVELHLDHSADTRDSSPRAYPLGVRCRNLELDLLWIASVLVKHRPSALVPPVPRRRAVAALLSLLDPRSRSDLGSLDDPRPALAEWPKIVKKFRRKLIESNGSP